MNLEYNFEIYESIHLRKFIQVVGVKTKNAIDSGLSVMACIGEQLADRQNGSTMVVCAEQLEAIKAALKEGDWKKVVIGKNIVTVNVK